MPRPDVERRLDEVPAGGLGVLIAPTGSGKSVLVSQWLASTPGQRVAVLTLAPRHTDIAVLARDLVATIRSVAPQVDPRLASLAATGQATLGHPLVDALLDGLASAPHDSVLVFEDAHELSNHPVIGDLGHLFTALPPTARGVVAMRSDPPWSLHQLRLDDRLVEIRGADLAFAEADAQALLEDVSRTSLTDAQVALLVERTDGWAAGLQLAAISLRTSRDIPGFVESFAGSDHLVSEYLLHEVIDEQEPAVRQFLLQTSVLDWLSADLCDAVTGLEIAAGMLDGLFHRSMFLIPLDEAGTTFRYQHLFADALRSRLRIENPHSVSALHHRAARWLLAHGHEEEAVGHLLDAGDPAGAFRVISRIGHHFVERGEAATLVRWLSTIAAEDPDGPVEVEVSLLAAQLAAGEGTAATETHRRLSRRPDLTLGERTAAEALSAFLVFRDLPPPQVLQVTDRVRVALQGLDPAEVIDFLGIGGADSVQAVAEYTSGLAHFLAGDLDRAADVLENARTLPGTRYVVWHVYVLSTLALVRAWQGRCTQAMGLARSAIEEARSVRLSDHLGSTHAHLALALVHLDRVEPDDARRCLADAQVHVHGRVSAGINADLEQVLQARLIALQDGPSAALDHLRSPLAAGSEATLVREERHALLAHLLIATGDLDGARTVAAGIPESAVLAPARVDLALATGDVPAARAALDGWTTAVGDVRAEVCRRLHEFRVLRAEGDQRGADRSLREAIAAARAEGLRWPFLEVPAALRVVRRGSGATSWLSDAAFGKVVARLEPGASQQQGLIEPLTPRELDVLAYLPGRMMHHEIATDLYVSVNTVKTHLSSIYRKLGVTERNAAITRASDLGLL
ncbi:MAG: hypothetical protein IPI13_04135 [Actinomycetales bacterium]|uniref:HTH luxR-type domain-containing protein n=1 Tax=Candidatus Phosphoribacter hodrii TaxID=2953743 RepID=A0A935IJK2_9MICO|nr:hypothetical protein [Candidatus Phosphoribacter hodrii]